MTTTTNTTTSAVTTPPTSPPLTPPLPLSPDPARAMFSAIKGDVDDAVDTAAVNGMTHKLTANTLQTHCIEIETSHSIKVTHFTLVCFITLKFAAGRATGEQVNVHVRVHVGVHANPDIFGTGA